MAYSNTVYYLCCLFVFCLAPFCIISASEALTKEVVVSVKDLAPGDVITREHLKKVESKHSIPSNAIKDLSSAVGKVARTSIAPEKAILPYQITSQKLVNKDSLVNVCYSNRNVKVNFKGKALESGGVNDLIKIRNEVSGAIINARIISPTNVEVIH